MSDSPLRAFFRPFTLSCLLAGCLAFSGHSLAAPVEGCDDGVLKAQQAVAKLRVAVDKAAIDQVNEVMPSSVLALTCFDQSAGISASTVGETFSGNFSQNPAFTSVLNDALTSMEANFLTDSLVGKLSLYTMSPVEGFDGSTFNCETPKKYWDAINEQGLGLAAGVPAQQPLDDYAKNDCATPTGAEDTYDKSFQSTDTQAACQDMKTKVDTAALPPPSIPDYGNPSVNDGTPCGVLQATNPSVTCP